MVGDDTPEDLKMSLSTTVGLSPVTCEETKAPPCGCSPSKRLRPAHWYRVNIFTISGRLSTCHPQYFDDDGYNILNKKRNFCSPVVHSTETHIPPSATPHRFMPCQTTFKPLNYVSTFNDMNKNCPDTISYVPYCPSRRKKPPSGSLNNREDNSVLCFVLQRKA